MTTAVADQHTITPSPLAARALEAGIRAARKGDRPLARRLLHKATELDPNREEAWLWLAGVTETPDEARIYLQTALALDPENKQARDGLRWIERKLKPAEVSHICVLCGGLVPAGQAKCPACGCAVADHDEPGASGRPTAELAPGLVLSMRQAEAIDGILDSMVHDSEARCIILADITGQLVSARGHTGQVNTQVLSALAAGELAATHEMARLVGERARFRLLLHEGETQSVYLSDVGQQMIVVIVFDVTTPIGLVRMILKQAVEQLKPILTEASDPDQRQQVNTALGSDFAQLLKSELDSSLS